MGTINSSKYILQLSTWTIFIQAASKTVGCVKEASVMLFSPAFPTILYLSHLLKQYLSPSTQACWIPEKNLTFAFLLNGNVLKITFIAFSNGGSPSFNSFLFIFSSLSQWSIHLNHQH